MVVLDCDNSCFALTCHWYPERGVVLMLPCKRSDLQPLDGQHKNLSQDHSLGTRPCVFNLCLPDITHTWQYLPLHAYLLQE